MQLAHRVVRLLAAVGALALAVTGCAESTTQGRTANGVPLKEPGKLTTCTHLDYKPFQFHDQGRIVGFDVDLVDRIAKDMGVTQQILDTPFEGIESGEALSTVQCDVAAAAMTITPTREQNFDFSDPYLRSRQVLLVKRSSGIHELSDLRGKTLAVQLSTTGEQYADQHARQYGYETLQYEDLPLSVTALDTGQVDAAINDDTVLGDYLETHPDLTLSEAIPTGDRYAIGVKHGNTKLLQQVNRSLAKLKRNGEYARIYHKWFGNRPQ